MDKPPWEQEAFGPAATPSSSNEHTLLGDNRDTFRASLFRLENKPFAMPVYSFICAVLREFSAPCPACEPRQSAHLPMLARADGT